MLAGPDLQGDPAQQVASVAHDVDVLGAQEGAVETLGHGGSVSDRGGERARRRTGRARRRPSACRLQPSAGAEPDRPLGGHPITLLPDGSWEEDRPSEGTRGEGEAG
ncbi:hypothetical protein GCM10018790_71140 [Kitasatospora xanthocidica]|nr:hypothetical protein GCM10018790_71140 [Kitasatospora xanthocidica]